MYSQVLFKIKLLTQVEGGVMSFDGFGEKIKLGYNKATFIIIFDFFFTKNSSSIFF